MSLSRAIWPFGRYKRSKWYEGFRVPTWGVSLTIEEELRLQEMKAKGWVPPFDVEHHGVGLADLPFEYAPDEVIYWEGDYDEAANACVREYLPFIRECMARWGLRFIYLPLLVEELTADARLWHYRQPYGEAHAAEGMVAPPSNFMLDYMERPENRPTVAKPAFAIFNLWYQGYEDDFKVTHFIYELYMLDVDAARSNPTAYFSYLAELCGRTQPSRLGCCKTGPPHFNDADEAFDRDTQIMLKEVEVKINHLRHRGVSDTVLQRLLKPEPLLSRLVVTPDYRLLLPDYDGMEVRMEPLPKTVFLFFLYHPEGVRFKCLSDYRQELADIYDRVRGDAVRSSRKNTFGHMAYNQSIMALTDPLNNSINEKCARIREAFLLCFSEDIAQHYFITGARGEPKGIRLPREKVTWECDNAPFVWLSTKYTNEDIMYGWTDEYGATYNADRTRLWEGIRGSVSTYAIRSGTKVICDRTFSSNCALTSIVIPDSVTTIGKEAFQKCENLTSIIIPGSVVNIGDSAFYGCSNLTSITLPASLTTIGKRAFNRCGKLETIIVAAGNLRYDSRGDCNALIETAQNALLLGTKRTVIPDSVTAIGDSAFRGCGGLAGIVIPDSVTTIGDSAFRGCGGLAGIVIPDSVIAIGDSAFCGCSVLTSVVIPDSVTAIGKSAFQDCSGLTSVVIPDSVTAIGKSAFRDCSGLTSVVIPDSVTAIGGSAFYNCSGLTSIVIPDSVTAIGDSAFYNCSGLTSIVIPDSVTTIGDSAFYGCSNLTSITLPASLTTIGKWAFNRCGKLETIIVAAGNPRYDSRGDCNALIETAHNTLLFGTRMTVIPDSVTAIGDSAFYGCSGLAGIVIPDSVTTIGDSAFYGCSGLTSVVIPDSVTTIGVSAFYGCVGLTGITLPASLTRIDRLAFCDSGLISITIPDSVTSIGALAFAGCRNLRSITLPASVTEIEYRAFDGSSSLKEIIIPLGTKKRFTELLQSDGSMFLPFELSDLLVER